MERETICNKQIFENILADITYVSALINVKKISYYIRTPFRLLWEASSHAAINARRLLQCREYVLSARIVYNYVTDPFFTAAISKSMESSTFLLRRLKFSCGEQLLSVEFTMVGIRI